MQQQEFTDCLTSYQNMAKMLKTCEYGEILEVVSGLTGSTSAAVEQYLVRYSEGDGIGTYQSVLQDLRKNIAQYDWLYDRLGDDISRTVLTNLIGYRIFPAQFFLEAAHNVTLQNFAQKDMRGNGQYEEMKEKGDIQAALLRNKEHIREAAPKLALYLQYCAGDMWEVPKIVDMIRPDYRFSLRFYCSASEAEIVLYALPQKQKQKTGKKARRIVSMPVDGGWNNAQLVKDCGAISYLLYKNHSCDVSMVGAKQDEYSNQKYVQGLKLEFLPDSTLQSKVNYLLKEADKIDGMLLYGAYTEYLPLADLYKSINPKGKIYLALDANSFWMDRIQWPGTEFHRFLDYCDVIGAAGHALQRHLNEKWPWVIDYLSNGFYNFSGTDMTFSYEKKGNIILTAGRLGTKEKSTHVLLEAFAAIAAQIPDWNLHLAGTVDSQWEAEYLAQFWNRFPALKERIHFLGPISDRDALYQEYLKAKIFALPSRKEGCPNVIAEALYAGDAMAIAKIDEYQDAIDYGKCGLAAETGDIEDFAEVLLRLCRDADLETLCRHAHEYARKNFDMESIVERLYYLLFGEE